MYTHVARFSFITTVVLLCSALMVQAAWSEPTESFPNGNTYPPLDQSGTTQVKPGRLQLNSLQIGAPGAMDPFLSSSGVGLPQNSGSGSYTYRSTWSDFGWNTFFNTSTIKTDTYLNVNGNVGVGTNSPQYKLHVVGDVNFTGNLYQNGTLFEPGGSGGSDVWQEGSGGSIYYSAGNVGIGTSAPSERLDVSGSIRIANPTWDTSTIYHNGHNLYIENEGYAHQRIQIRPGGSTDGALYSSIQLYDADDSATTNYTEKVKIYSHGASYFLGGNVGIGLTDPTNKLSVVGDIGLLREQGADVLPGPGPSIILQSPASNNVATNRTNITPCPTCNEDDDTTPLGNAEYLYTCESQDAGQTYVDVGYFRDQYGTITGPLYISDITCVAGTHSYAMRANDGTLEFLNSQGTSQFAVTQNADVGIGVIPTQGRLEVQMDAADGTSGITLVPVSGATARLWIDSNDGLRINRGGTTHLYVKNNGNLGVGINNTDPSVQFDVDGRARVDASTQGGAARWYHLFEVTGRAETNSAGTAWTGDNTSLFIGVGGGDPGKITIVNPGSSGAYSAFPHGAIHFYGDGENRYQLDEFRVESEEMRFLVGSSENFDLLIGGGKVYSDAEDIETWISEDGWVMSRAWYHTCKDTQYHEDGVDYWLDEWYDTDNDGSYDEYVGWTATGDVEFPEAATESVEKKRVAEGWGAAKLISWSDTHDNCDMVDSSSDRIRVEIWRSIARLGAPYRQE